MFEKINIPVIWKWDTGVTADVPKNVLIKDWLPQQDLLAHPNLKVESILCTFEQYLI